MNTHKSNSKSVVLYVTTGLGTGGAERMLYNLLSMLNQERFSPVVVSLIDNGTVGDRIEALGIPVHTIGMEAGRLPTPNVFWRLIHLVREIKPDLIQGWMYHGNLAAQLASIFSQLRNIPVLWNIQHSMYSLEYEKKTTRAVIQLGAKLSKYPISVVFVSQTGKLQHEAIGYCSNNSCVIPNTSDTSLFIPSFEAKLSVRSELGLAENTFLIGLFARYHPMKDHSNFLHAAALLLKYHPDIHFLLAGTEVNQENQTLYQLLEQLGLFNHVHLLGERNDMPRLTAALDIASSASAYGEAFPLILGEAMSCGVPCVVTDVGDSGWIVGNTGTVVPSKNPELLANAWKELIDLSAEGRENLGKAARARIIEDFSLSSVVGQYEKLYESSFAKKLTSKSK